MLDLLSRVNPQQLAQAGRHAGAAAGDLARVRHALEVERGRAPEGEVPHSRARPPFVRTIELTASGMATPPTVDEFGVRDFGAVAPTRRVVAYEDTLGKPATRGHVMNVGANPFLVRFLTSADEWSDWYELHSGLTLDHGAWTVRQVEIATIGPMHARAQVLAQ